MREVGALITADNRNAAMHDTWGHLFPSEDKEVALGYIVCTQGCFGDCVILDYDIKWPDSPWLYASLYDWLDTVDREFERGEVWRYEVRSWVEQGDDDCERITFEGTGRRRLHKPKKGG